MGQLANDMNAYVMGFFLSLSIINVWENSTTFFRRRTKLDALQWVSSVSQIINLVLHFMLNTAQNLPCIFMAVLEAFFYEIFQLGCAIVIIYRATAIITNQRQRLMVRSGLALLEVVSLALNITSVILMEMKVIEGTCVPIYQRQYNDASQIVVAVLYFILLVAFSIPVVQNIRKSQQFVDNSTLRNVATITATKLILAILFQVVTVIISLRGVFGDYFWIQFTLQNFSLVWASTVASRKPLPEKSTSIALTSSNRKTPSASAISASRLADEESDNSRGWEQIDNQHV